MSLIVVNFLYLVRKNMNHIYNVRFNSRTGRSVVTSELAKSHANGKQTARKIAVTTALILSAALGSVAMSEDTVIAGTHLINSGAVHNLDSYIIDSTTNSNSSRNDRGFGINLKNNGLGATELYVTNSTITSRDSGIHIDLGTLNFNTLQATRNDVLIDVKNTQITAAGQNISGGPDAIYVGAKGTGDIRITTDKASTLNTTGNTSSQFGIAIQTRDSITGNLIVDNSATINTANQSNNSGIFLQASDGHKITGNVTYINRGTMNIQGNSSGIHLSLRDTVTGDVLAENHGNISAPTNGIFIEADRAKSLVEGKIDIVNAGMIRDGKVGILLSGKQNSTNTVNISLHEGSDIQNNIGIKADLLKDNNITLYAGAAIHAKDKAIVLREIGANVGSVSISNAGSLNSDTDLLIMNETNTKTNDYNLSIANAGVMNGYITLTGSNPVDLSNSGTWVIQDRKQDEAIVTLSANGKNSIANTGIINFNAKKTQLLNADTMDHSGVMDLTIYQSGHSTVHFVSSSKDSTFKTNGGRIKFGLHNNDTTASGIISDNLYLENTVLGGQATALTFTYDASELNVIDNTKDIEVIYISGNSADKAFTQGNDVFLGNKEYLLERQANGDWHLVSYDLADRSDAGLDMAAKDSVINSMIPGLSGNGLAPNGIGGSGALRSGLRLGSSSQGTVTGQKSNALWAFSTANHSKGSAQGKQLKYHSDTYTLNVGADRSFAVDKGLLELGGLVFMSSSKHDATNRITGSRAKGDTDGYGFGLYGTYFFEADSQVSPYIDMLAIFGRYKNTNKTRGNDHYSYKSNAFSLSLATGYPIQLTESMILEPQIQTTYIDYKSSKHKDHNNASVKFKTDGHLISRVGAYLIMNTDKEDFQPYVAMNLWYDDTQSKINYDASNDFIKSDKRGTFYEAKAGFQAKASENFVYWGEVSTRVGKHDYRDYGVAIGIKYLW